ncbi:hypothetical protein ACU4GR_25745 [Methylobacterium oryzae CBMB20]
MLFVPSFYVILQGIEERRARAATWTDRGPAHGREIARDRAGVSRSAGVRAAPRRFSEARDRRQGHRARPPPPTRAEPDPRPDLLRAARPPRPLTIRHRPS